ncbi:MAG: hypothetical protein LBH71_02305 [Oscillospiraceae bacterium]|jgi:hypothetical protein|nr:hypothetical protein [Oscillospiraceae bacterium]
MFSLNKKIIYSGESQEDYDKIIEIIKKNNINYECNTSKQIKTITLRDQKKEEEYNLYEIKVSKKDYGKVDALLKNI